MLQLEHLGVSQSERIVWLFEELGLDYKLVLHVRGPLLSPQSLKDVPGNVTGKSPFLVDTETKTTLSESGAICEYIIHRYGGGRLSAAPSDKIYPEYLQWFHFANGTLQAAMVNSMFLAAAEADDKPIMQTANDRLHTALKVLDERLQESKWLAGEFSAADIMTLYCTSTQRYFGPQISLKAYPNIVRWMKDCGERPAYQRAMEKADPDMKQLLTAEPPAMSMAAAGGIDSNLWKKTSRT